MENPEHDCVIERSFEVISQDENPIERGQKLNQSYEDLDELEIADEPTHEQGATNITRA